MGSLQKHFFLHSLFLAQTCISEKETAAANMYKINLIAHNIERIL